MREVALVPFFCLRKLKLRGAGPPAGVSVPAAALAPGRPGRLLHVPFGPRRFLCLPFPSCFLTLLLLTGAAAHWRFRNGRAPALRPRALSLWPVLWNLFPQDLALVEPQNRWNPICLMSPAPVSITTSFPFGSCGLYSGLCPQTLRRLVWISGH